MVDGARGGDGYAFVQGRVQDFQIEGAQKMLGAKSLRAGSRARLRALGP